MNNQQSKKGFTLIELLIVIAILGALASVVILRFTGAQASAKDAKRQSELKQYQTSLEVYANRTNNYPTQASAGNLAGLCTTLGLTGCPDDPITTQNYKYVSSAGARYVMWATLERKSAGSTQYFVMCSNGKVGTVTTAPTNDTCPI